MNNQAKVEALAVIEKVAHQELPALASLILNAWCARAGVTAASIEEFVKRMTSAGTNEDITEVLDDMLGAYRVGAIRFGDDRGTDTE